MTGAARVAQEAKERQREREREQEIDRRKREFAASKAPAEAQVSALTVELGVHEQELEKLINSEEERKAVSERDRTEIARLRSAD